MDAIYTCTKCKKKCSHYGLKWTVSGFMCRWCDNKDFNVKVQTHLGFCPDCGGSLGKKHKGAEHVKHCRECGCGCALKAGIYWCDNCPVENDY